MSLSGRTRAVLTTLVAVAAFSVAGVGAQAAGSPPDGPDLEAMALAPSDFDGGAAIDSQGFITPGLPAIAEYQRYFRPGARLAGRRLLYASNIIIAFDDAGTATSGFAAFQAELNTPAGRRTIGNSVVSGFKQGASGKVKLRSVAVGRPVALRLGQGAFRLAIVLRTNRGRIELALTALRVDRAIGLTGLAAYPKTHLTSAPAVLATARLAQRFQQGFILRNTVPPSIVGTPQQGQALTADVGHWAGAPGAFAYQWNRCDTAGANCAAIPGAVAQTYVPTASDSTARITVTVTASNSVSTSSASSSATPQVP